MTHTRRSFRINNTELIFTNSIYISPNGNDATGNGTIEQPYKTIKFASGKVVNNTTAIILLPGEYNEDPYDNTAYINTSSNSSNLYFSDGSDQRFSVGTQKYSLFTSQNYQLNFIGYDKDTVINTSFTQPYSSVACAGSSQRVYLYNLIVNVECINSNYYNSNSLFAGSHFGRSVMAYNCMFRYVKRFDRVRGIFHAGWSHEKFVLTNCIIDMGDVTNAKSGNKNSSSQRRTNGYYTGWSAYSAFTDYSAAMNGRLEAVNCIFRNIIDWGAVQSSETDSNSPLILTNCIVPNTTSYGALTLNAETTKADVGLDNDYYPSLSNSWINTGVTSIRDINNRPSSIGLYGGPYAWFKTISRPAIVIMDNFVQPVRKETIESYNFRIDPPNTTDFTRIEETFSGNFIDDTGIKYEYPIDKRTWSKMDRIEFL